MFEIILIINILASFFMTGLIWFIQIVQYPGFQKISAQNFQSFHRFHIARTGIVVIPPMLAELGTSLWLTIAFDQLWSLNATGLALVTTIWISTFFVQLPVHKKLQGTDFRTYIPRLIATNWIRTILWSAKAGIGGYLLIWIT